MTMFRNRCVTWQAKRGTVRPRLSPLEVDHRTIRPYAIKELTVDVTCRLQE